MDEEVPAHPTNILLQIARYHHQHERYYATKTLEDALRLRKNANILRTLADRWLQGSEGSGGPSAEYSDPRYSMAGSEDLNDLLSIASVGVLFMEGQGTPRELTLMRREIDHVSQDYGQLHDWLQSEMKSAWARDFDIRDSAAWGRAVNRHRTLIGTTRLAILSGLVREILSAALGLFDDMDFNPSALREDLHLAGTRIHAIASLIDAGAEILAEHAIVLGRSDERWARYVKELRTALGAD